VLYYFIGLVLFLEVVMSIFLYGKKNEAGKKGLRVKNGIQYFKMNNTNQQSGNLIKHESKS